MQDSTTPQSRFIAAVFDEHEHVDYELLDAVRDGGGPHYVIDARTGKILAKRYEQ